MIADWLSVSYSEVFDLPYALIQTAITGLNAENKAKKILKERSENKFSSPSGT